MMQILKENRLTIDFYHGTSTLFLDSIIKYGLAGVNPVSEWDISGLCKEVYELSGEYLKETGLYQKSYSSLKKMVEQTAAENFNFQHGQTYISPSQQTAVRYANKRVGSEILTYTINFLQELIKKEIPYVTKDLSRRYSKIYGLIESNPSPLLVQIKNIDISSLLSEVGQSPESNLTALNDAFVNFNDSYELFVQQDNYRLITPVQKNNLELYLINIQNCSQLNPKYNLYKLNAPDF